MGTFMSRRADDAKAGVATAVVRSKLADLKATKAQRDFQCSMTMAKLRDQMHFMLGFYGLLVSVNCLRAYRYKKFEPVPLSSIPFIAGPVFFAYNLDASYGNKLERLNQEAAMIRGAEKHWFNDPINLPRSLEADYRAMVKESNLKLLKINAKPEPDWATFNETTIDELVDGSTPLSRTLHSLGAL